MSQDRILLDLNAVNQRLVLFNSIFPSDAIKTPFTFSTKESTSENLDGLARAILHSRSVAGHVFLYKHIFLEIIARWTTSSKKDEYVLVIEKLANIITIFPFGMSLIEDYLDKENDHFITILQNPSSQKDYHLFKILLAYYRLLYHNKEVFARFIQPDVLYQLVDLFAEDQENQVITFLALKVLSLYLDMGEKAINDMLDTYIKSHDKLQTCFEGDSKVDYNFLELNEAKRFANFSKLPNVPECFKTNKSHHYFVIEPQDLNTKVTSICGVVVPKVHTISDNVSYPLTFVPTQETVSSLRQLGRTIQNSTPLMLVGKAGSGKTFLINELSKYMGCHDSLVKIHLGEQTDAKLLIGTYTSGDKPGTFEWRAGVLATAVKEGRWVLIEDIDKAPTDVLSILLSLLEKRELIIPSRGETVKAANGFQLISTVRINENHSRENSTRSYNLNMIGMRIWNVVELEEPSEEDLAHILAQKFPILTNLIPKLINSYKSVKSIYLNTKFISLNKGAHTRIVSVRDLIKLCKRLDALFKSNDIRKPDQLIESSVYDSVFSEAADCFAGALGEFKALEPIIQAIGESLDISSSRISLFLTQHVPTLEYFGDNIKIGRALLPKERLNIQKKSVNNTSFAFTNHSLRLMEQISVCIQMTEPVLLVGETGTGKTTVVQQLAKMLAKTLTVINVSQQTETGDLLGGYKPVNSKTVAVPIQEVFETLFNATFSLKKNEKFHKMLHKCFNKNQWKNVVRLWNEAYKMAQSILKTTESNDQHKNTNKKKRRLNNYEKKLLLDKWQDFKDSVKKFEAQSSSIENSFVFNFVEGSLVKAIRAGEWLLLDEVNLATADTLESISDLLTEPNSRSILLSEKGDAEPIKAHPDFRIFACMNPATDVGKRDLPMGIRSRFTEIYVHSPERDITDLLSIIDKYIGKYSVSDEWVGNDIAELYLEAKKLADNNIIVDGSNQKPHFSIRTLTRTLLYVTDIIHIYGLRRSLYDGFCMSFLTLLDQKSETILEPVIGKFTLGRLKNVKSIMSQTPPSPGPGYVQFKHYWMKKGPNEIQEQAHYIITPFVEKNMMNLVRATSGKRFPVLIQGPTSSGKTSMIKYLADITGHKFVRINNHEHTDLQEYLGTYVTDDTGKLSFKEGVLVEALRKGYWIVLDELNLAPTDVLEALNRLLDDNRELFIPETQEVVHPHPDFLLFATQNPPGIYGGRKILSRAFRNRFLELHFDDIPQDELEIILRERCQIAPSYAKKIVEVYRQLSIERSASRLFEQKNSFATLRDLFRWAMRDAVGYEQLAASGYMLLAERCRSPQEKVTVKKILEKVMKVNLNMDQYYASLEDASLGAIDSVTWTKGMRRLSVLVSSCLKNKEPVLLVGETGCGKTTICQILAQFMGRELITLNAHQNTETGDILGAQRPVRNRSEIQYKLTECLKSVLNVDNDEEVDLQELLQLYSELDDKNIPEEARMKIKKLRDSLNVLFEWSDGPLIQAMKTGNFFLLDEISLADDSVLERLNSVLEPERSLLLAEQGSSDSLVTASENFQFFATMNPGGDYGKKELSPALRNRFTEIWVPSMEDFNDVNMIVSSKLSEDLKDLANPIVKFSEWFGKKLGGGNAASGVISLRDILAWVEFINKVFPNIQNKSTVLIQGASMVFIDALGTNNTAHLAENENDLKSLRSNCIVQLLKLCDNSVGLQHVETNNIIVTQDDLQVGMFKIPRLLGSQSSSFNLTAPTTASNLVKVVRAMQVHKPILLEGSPGVGKTSLITALANITGNKLTRINLSEQTDLVDLFGADSPGERTGEFLWHDAPFLRAMKKGEWVLLDEMNLASQSVLEGLNACLDHRGEAYIPELDISFSCHPNFLVFAAQNPQYQGGGRKGLPKSFVNRFSVVFIDMLTSDDLLLIAKHLYPSVEPDVITKMIKLMSALEEQVCKKKLWGNSGSPWEFNLRDTLRWLKLLNQYSICEDVDVFDFVNIIVKQRFRTSNDKDKAQLLIEDIFGKFLTKRDFFKLTEEYIQINNEVALRNPHYHYPIAQNLFPLKCNVAVYESVLKAVNNNWPLVLVGPSNSGKTEIIRLLASLLGPKVDVFSMNSDIDSMDILGGYEQVDLTRKISYITEDLTSVVREIISINMKLSPNVAAIMEGLNLLKYMLNNIVTPENFQDFTDRFNKFFSHLEGHSSLKNISQDIGRMSEILIKEASVRFEWFDGMLVKAVEKGHWLLLDNANLCSPSVLDRLNSLLETDGSLLINECSQADGQPRVLKPHPDFRLFLTMDPKYGELSRAMRNRGVEIYIDELQSRSTTFDRLTLGFEPENTNVDSLSIDDGIKEMELNESKMPIPLKHFVPSYLSRPCVFAQVHDIILLSDEDPLEESLAAVVPISSLGEVGKWTNNILNCMEYSEKNIAEKLHFFITFLTDMGIIKKINKLYTPANRKLQAALGLQERNLTEETVLVTLNEYVVPTICKFSDNIKSPEPLYLLSTLRLLLNILNALKSINTKSSRGKIDELTYIESSAAAFNGRHLKNTPRIPIFSILYNISTAISDNLKTECLFCSSNKFQHYWDLLVIVSAALETGTTKDEARLRVYKELIDHWIASAKTKSDIEITPFININSEFTDVLHLSRGHSITLLWDKFRKKYPTTSNSWLAFERLVDLSKKFDKVRLLQFSESYNSIQDLMVIFRLLLEDVLNNNLSELDILVSRLEDGINELEFISNKFLNKRKHYFASEFDNLVRYAFSVDTVELIKDLAPASSLATQKLTKLVINEYCYPPVFDILWAENDAKFSSFTSSIFSSQFLEGVVRKSNDLKKFSGNQIKQSISDAELLLSSTIKCSPSLLRSQIKHYNDILLTWIRSIVDIHAGRDCSELSLEKTSFLIQEKTVPETYATFEEYILPALELTESLGSLEALGEAWVLFGTGLLLLFVPDSPYDPAIHDYVLYDLFVKTKTFSQSLVKNWKNVRKVTSGDEKIYTEELINVISDDDAPQAPRVYRTNISIDCLFDEWMAFLTSTMSSQQIKELVGAYKCNSDQSNYRLEMLQQNSTHFLNRLESGYPKFADLNDILAGYIYSVNFGFDLLKLQKSKDMTTFQVSPLWSMDPINISNTESVSSTYYELSKFFKKNTVENSSVEKILLYFLTLFKFHKCDAILLEVFKATLYTLYSRWSLRRLRQEQQENEKSSMFKFNDNSDDYDADFKNLFPDYEDTMLLADEKDASSPENLDEIYFQLANMYISIFDKNYDTNFSSELKNGAIMTTIFSEELENAGIEKLKSGTLSAVINRLDEEIQSFKNGEDFGDIDFYHDFSIPQFQKASEIIEIVLKSVLKLLKQWPEHATLNELYRVCQEFLNYPAQTPLARQLQKIEQIYTFLAEWEKYASSEVSLNDTVKMITNLIVSWRKMELRTWKGLFNSEDEKIRKSIGKWWFFLYESIIVSNFGSDKKEVDANTTLLVSSLNLFFSKSTLGEFTARLDLVKAFYKHIQLIGLKSSKIESLLLNTLKFYHQFKPLIDERITNGRKGLEKEIDDIILLASWKDVNVDALKQSSRKSHNNLYKIVRKYRDLLSGDVKSIIEAGLMYSKETKLKLPALRQHVYEDSNLEASKDLVKKISSWSTRPAPLRNIDVVTTNMDSYLEMISSQVFPNFADLASDFYAEAERLRKETPGVYTKENKKILAYLKTQKSKALGDALKELRRIGLKVNFREDIQKVQSSTTTILANLAPFNDKYLNSADAFFFKILDLLPKLRNAVSSPSDDIPIAAIERGMALAQSLIFSLITVRHPLLEFSKDYSSVNNMMLDLESFTRSKGEIVHCSLKTDIDNIRLFEKWLPSLLDYAAQTLSVISKYSKTSEQQTVLLNAKSTLSSFFLHFNSSRVFDSSFIESYSRFESFINELLEKLEKAKEAENAFVFDIIIEWIKTNKRGPIKNEQKEGPSVEEVEQAFRSIFTSILLSFQKIIGDGFESISESDDKWLSTSFKKIMVNVKLLRSGLVSENIGTALSLLKNFDFSTTKSVYVKSIISFTLPVITHYYNAMTIVLDKSRTYYTNTSHGTYILSTILHSLAKNGFCSPEPPSEEVDDKNLQDGTGLGDGEGAQNNNKDVEQDEDLTEDAQKENKDQQDKDERNEENEDDAVEMEGDMAGELEDLSNGEDENENENTDDEEEELDEEIDDLNEDDPNAIDDKMWDEKASENSKEKDTDQNLDGKDQKEDVQAAENDEQQQDKKEEGEENSNTPDDGDEEIENDEDAEEENDAGEQDDEVKDEQGEDLEANVPEIETLDLPEDMNLDSEREASDEDANMSDEMPGDLDEQEAEDENKEVEQEADNKDNNDDDESGSDADADEAGTISNDENDAEVDVDMADDEEGENEEDVSEEQAMSDEENLKQDDSTEENKEKGGEQNAEGLDGIEEKADVEEIDQEAAVQQDSGSKGAGADTKDMQEQEDVGGSGTTENTYDEDQEDSTKKNEESREEATAALKQLGDSLKEYHKRRQDIKEAPMNGEEDDNLDENNERPDEFEHVEGANTETDTQALGSATQDQLQTIDEDMAIDDDREEQEVEQNELVENADEKMDIDQEDMLSDVDDLEANKDNESKKSGFIGERKREQDFENGLTKEHLLEDQEDEDDLQVFTENIDSANDESATVSPERSLEESRELWHKSEVSTADLVSRLGEQLRLILEPTLATKLKGDYKTGKRLNMKRIIPYIASQFRKDKIWLRRTKPSKRQYQIMVALDDSKSMSESKCVKLAFDSLCLVSKTLTQLEAGGLSIVKFGENAKEVHSFDQQFSSESGARAFQWFGFQETKTDVKKLVAESIKIFERARAMVQNDQWQLEIVISDGICEDHETIQKLVRRARENKIMLVFVIIDGITSNESILDMSQVNYIPDQFGNPQLKISKYLDTFPFEFYVVVHDISELPEMLSLILRQYFTDLASS